MGTWNSKVVAAALLALFAVAASGQRDDRAPFQLRDGYEEARFGSQDVTIKTRDGSKTLRVSLEKLRVAQTERPASIRLPGAGLALLQHSAGTANVTVGRERFAPLEGEWMRLSLPTELRLATDNDTITLDLILIEE